MHILLLYDPGIILFLFYFHFIWQWFDLEVYLMFTQFFNEYRWTCLETLTSLIKRMRIFMLLRVCSQKKKSSIDLRFVKLIGNLLFMIYYRWALIAGRVPGRKAEEIERYWIMRHCEGFASRRKQQKRCNS